MLTLSDVQSLVPDATELAQDSDPSSTPNPNLCNYRNSSTAAQLPSVLQLADSGTTKVTMEDLARAHTQFVAQGSHVTTIDGLGAHAFAWDGTSDDAALGAIYWMQHGVLFQLAFSEMSGPPGTVLSHVADLARRVASRWP